jgi:hypothetical protein
VPGLHLGIGLGAKVVWHLDTERYTTPYDLLHERNMLTQLQHVQGVAGHPGVQGGGPKKNNRKNIGPRRRRGTRGCWPPPQKKTNKKNPTTTQNLSASSDYI